MNIAGNLAVRGLSEGDGVVEPIEATIAGVLGIPPERVLLSCSHTHCGPALAGNDLKEPAG